MGHLVTRFDTRKPSACLDKCTIHFRVLFPNEKRLTNVGVEVQLWEIPNTKHPPMPVETSCERRVLETLGATERLGSRGANS